MVRNYMMTYQIDDKMNNTFLKNILQFLVELFQSVNKIRNKFSLQMIIDSPFLQKNNLIWIFLVKQKQIES